jgi:hypothetical protein
MIEQFRKWLKWEKMTDRKGRWPTWMVTSCPVYDVIRHWKCIFTIVPKQFTLRGNFIWPVSRFWDYRFDLCRHFRSTIPLSGRIKTFSWNTRYPDFNAKLCCIEQSHRRHHGWSRTPPSGRFFYKFWWRLRLQKLLKPTFLPEFNIKRQISR